MPAVELDPELTLALFLPPLLQVSAYRTDWIAFRSNLRSILLLAVGAVFFTAAAAEVVQEYALRADRASVEGQDPDEKAEQLDAQQHLRLIAIEAARAKLRERTDEVDTETHRALAEELDLEEQQIRRALGET